MLPYLKGCPILLCDLIRDKLIDLQSFEKYELLLYLSAIDYANHSCSLSDIYKFYY
jgi:hypothetical protein